MAIRPAGDRSSNWARSCAGACSRTVGGAVFVEGGNVYDNSLPEFDEPIRWGVGVGVRYFTEFGPLRFDVAFPINPRRHDDAFQFYVGIGQAF